MSIGKNIKTLRQINGINQKDFAKSIDVTQSALSMYENDTSNPSIIVLKKIAKTYNYSIDRLLDVDIKMEDRVKAPGQLLEILMTLETSDLEGIEIVPSNSGITITIDREDEISGKPCAFMKDYLEHKSDFASIKDDEIRKICIATWIQKKLTEYDIECKLTNLERNE